MPEPLARLALVNKRVVYDLLFHAAAETVRPGREPRRVTPHRVVSFGFPSTAERMGILLPTTRYLSGPARA
jgi:hypothetical protein